MTVVFVICGASGDLARRKTFPALLSLIRDGNLDPKSILIVGYARTHLPLQEFLSRFDLEQQFTGERAWIAQELKNRIHYFSGSYADSSSWLHLASFLSSFSPSQLVFYLALPPNVFFEISSSIKQWFSEHNHVKIVVEKPFGTNTETAKQLNSHFESLFQEQQLFRIDHYLGKDMVKNTFTLRFCNHFFSAIWNQNHLSNVQIVFKETLGVEGRAGYFDSAGILRDVFQNHLLQILSIIAMEPPVSFGAEDIRNEKTKLLRCINRNIQASHCVFGQYSGYQEEAGVRKGSGTCTFASVALFIDNERWSGVPFILKCGKGLNESKAEIRVQLKDTPAAFRYFGAREEIVRNELVIRVQPKEAIYLKLVLRKPGTFEHKTEIAELDLSYACRFGNLRIPDAYESLLLDVVNGDQSNFVRSDELLLAWEIADRVISHSETADVISYQKGTRGPVESDELIRTVGQYRRSEKEYLWPKL